MSKIKDFLREMEDGDKLLNDLDRIKGKAEPLLAKIVETFPEYTSHDISHSERILEKFNFLIPDSLFEKINSYELYFLIASTYLHDIGMVNLPDFAEPEFEKLTDENKKKLQEIIRERHHLRSETYCIEKYKDFLIGDPHQAAIIGRICRGHRKENLHDITLFMNDRKYKGYSINVALLASLLRNGDELDITFERTSYVVYENTPPRDKISKEEWAKHLSISGVGIVKQDEQTIKCSATCKNPKIHRLLKALEIKVNKGIEDYFFHLYHYQEVKKEIPRKFVIDIESIGYEPYDFKFSLQEIEVMNLLMGDKLYERKEECLRELLKNAVDACRLRKFRLKEDEDYRPKIAFELNSDELIVSDNGIGMNKYIIENYFTKIGKSYYRSEEFAEEAPDFSPVSELGIGVLSYFMIAELVRIETKTEEDDAISIEFDNVSSYFIVKKGSMRRQGTKITLSLKEEAKVIDLEREIAFFASHLEFPVKVFSDGKEISVKSEEFLTNKLLIEPKMLLTNELLIKTGILDRIGPVVQSHIVNQFIYGIDIYLRSIDALSRLFQNSQLKIHTLYIKDDFVEGKIGFLIANEVFFENLSSHKLLRAIFNLGLSQEFKDGPVSNSFDPLEGMARISYGGIHVCYEGLRIPWLNSMLLADFNLKKNTIDINIARDKCINNDKKNKFNHFIEESLLKSIKDYLDTMKTECGKDFPRQAYAFMNTFIKFPSSLTIENYFCNGSFLNEYYYLKKITKNGVSYIKYNDSMFETEKKIVLLTEVPLDSDLENILYNFNGFKEDHVYLVYTKNLYNLILNTIEKRVNFELLCFCDLLESHDRYTIRNIKYEPKMHHAYEFHQFYNEDGGFNLYVDKFLKYTSSRYIGFICSSGFIFNFRHKFIEFLFYEPEPRYGFGGRVFDKIFLRNKEILGRFFRCFMNIQYNNTEIDSIISFQRDLLSYCLEENLISKKGSENLILSKEDFVMYPHGINF